ncbi:Agenet domain-containing protein, partial [Prunus dulcis]
KVRENNGEAEASAFEQGFQRWKFVATKSVTEVHDSQPQSLTLNHQIRPQTTKGTTLATQARLWRMAPPDNPDQHFEPADVVDASYLDTWWVGVAMKFEDDKYTLRPPWDLQDGIWVRAPKEITQNLTEEKYLVRLKFTKEVKECSPSDLRPHMEWTDSGWVTETNGTWADCFQRELQLDDGDAGDAGGDIDTRGAGDAGCDGHDGDAGDAGGAGGDIDTGRAGDAGGDK